MKYFAGTRNAVLVEAVIMVEVCLHSPALAKEKPPFVQPRLGGASRFSVCSRKRARNSICWSRIS